MDKDELKLERYKSALGLLTFEAQFLWTIFSTFLLVHTILLGFIVQNSFKDNLFLNYNLPCFISGLVGLILIFPWYGTYKRNSDFYELRMAQSRICEPENWDLIADVGQKFADGKKVKLDGKDYQIGKWGMILRNRYSVPILVVVFLFVYLIIIFSSGPWNSKTSTQEVKKCCIETK